MSKPSAYCIEKMVNYAYSYRPKIEDFYHLFFTGKVEPKAFINFLKSVSCQSLRDTTNLPNIDNSWANKIKQLGDKAGQFTPFSEIKLFSNGPKLADMLNDSQTSNMSLYDALLFLYQQYDKDPNWETNLKALASDPEAKEIFLEEAKEILPEEAEKIFLEAKEIFIEAFESKEDQETCYVNLIKKYHDIDMHYFFDLKKLSNTEDIDDYILDQKQKLNKLDFSKPEEVNNFKATCHIIEAIRTLLSTKKVDLQSLKSTESSRSIILFSEHLNALCTRSPKKARAISNELSKLMQEHSITFQNIIDYMKNNDPSIQDLKKAMGHHENLFYRILSYFCPIQTHTMRFFVDKIQNTSNLTDADIHYNPPRS